MRRGGHSLQNRGSQVTTVALYDVFSLCGKRANPLQLHAICGMISISNLGCDTVCCGSMSSWN